MKKFLDKDFLLTSETAQKLFHDYAEKEPVFDFHNHLNPKEIYDDRQFENLAQVWLDGDHYKWRAMRAAGIPENLITGKGDDYERFLADVKTLELCVGNPLYHWTHLELQRYFGITEPLTEKNAKETWDKCNSLLQKKEYSVRGLLKMQNVKFLCTTDDPIDTLEYHKKLLAEKKDGKIDFEVKPSFRPDPVINIEKTGFRDYIKKLGEASGVKINDVVSLVDALENRVKYFKENGALVSDHSLEGNFFAPYTTEDVERVFRYRMDDMELNEEEICQYKSFILTELGMLYKKYGLVMQIHIGAMRDNNSSLLESAGLNCGVDSLADFNFAPQLSHILDSINSHTGLPKTILYNLNPRDNEMLATLAGNFSNDVSPVQFGPAWWFNDHKDGIEEQLRVFARTGVLGKFVGMLTDSRSFLSFPRHEYFRRILCNFIGNLVENGEYPWDEETLSKIVRDISYNNAEKFFM